MGGEATAEHTPAGWPVDCMAIVGLWTGMTWVLWPLQDKPFLDDWTYAWSVERFLRTGELKILDWSVSLNVVQTLWGALFAGPFGFSFTALRASTAVATVIGLCVFYLFLRRIGLPRGRAALGVAVMWFNPVFFILSWTYMTDVPFLTLMIGAMLLMLTAQSTRSVCALAAAEVCGACAVGTRAVGIAIPAAIGLSQVVLARLERRRLHLLVTVVLPFVLVANTMWWASSHTEHVADLIGVERSPANRMLALRYILPLFPRYALVEATAVISVLGLWLLPLSVAIASWRRRRRYLYAGVAAAMVFALAAALGVQAVTPLSPDAIWAAAELGASLSLLPGHGLPPQPPILVFALTSVAVASWAVALGEVTTIVMDLWKSPLAFSAVLGFSHLALISVFWLAYDRYLLVLLPLAIALCLQAARTVRPVIAWVGVVCFAIVCGLGTRAQLSYTAAMWSAVDALRSAGARASEIEGGYTVNGWLQYAHPEDAPRDAEGQVMVPWINSNARLPFHVSSTTSEGGMLVGEFPYRRMWGGAGVLYAMRR